MDFSDPGVGKTLQDIEGIQSPSHPLTQYHGYSVGNMLAWMTSELLKAEQAGEKVHILSHVPAGALLPCFIFPCILFVVLVLSFLPMYIPSNICKAYCVVQSL